MREKQTSETELYGPPCIKPTMWQERCPTPPPCQDEEWIWMSHCAPERYNGKIALVYLGGQFNR